MSRDCDPDGWEVHICPGEKSLKACSGEISLQETGVE